MYMFLITNEKCAAWVHILRALLSIYVQLCEELVQFLHLDVPWAPQILQAKN